MSPGNLPSTVVAAQWQGFRHKKPQEVVKEHVTSKLLPVVWHAETGVLSFAQGPVVASPSTATAVPTAHMADPTSSRPLPSTSAATDQSGQGSESLRSSDEFPANKENNHSRFGTTQHASAAGAQHSMRAAGSESACVVSEQTLAQEAVYALQVTPCLFIMCQLMSLVCVNHRGSQDVITVSMPKHVLPCVDLCLLTADFLYVSRVTLEVGMGSRGALGVCLFTDQFNVI